MSKDNGKRTIRRALISVYHKDGLEPIIRELATLGVEIISTGGTYDFIRSLGVEAVPVEDLTGYPSILGGRVKTLHPAIFGGILSRREHEKDIQESREYRIGEIDLVVVDLYPFEQYVRQGASHSEIIEKIDIGGISLIRAAAKNHHDVVIIPAKESYGELLRILKDNSGETTIEERANLAAHAFLTSSHYDTAIFNYMNRAANIESFSESVTDHRSLRYGENPHQMAIYFGSEKSLPEQIHGKEISYNNLLDIEAAIELISDFTDITVAIIKHNNACGCASRPTLIQAWKDALAGDPVSAFGGIIVANTTVDKSTAEEINKIFFEVIIAPSYDKDALAILQEKKNRIILISGDIKPTTMKFRSLLGGVLSQQRDDVVEKPEDLTVVTKKAPAKDVIDDLIFANILVKHSKSNAIVLVKDKMLLASGIGQTSRVDALRQAIGKAKSFGQDLDNAVMASDAFFPFPDCVEIADDAGIRTVIHPGGSINDKSSIEYCDEHNMAMVITGKRHFKH